VPLHFDDKCRNVFLVRKRVLTDYPLDIIIVPAGFVINLDGLYVGLARLADRRHARGKRYERVILLAFFGLAKLGGEDRLYGISPRVFHHRAARAKAFYVQ